MYLLLLFNILGNIIGIILTKLSFSFLYKLEVFFLCILFSLLLVFTFGNILYANNSLFLKFIILSFVLIELLVLFSLLFKLLFLLVKLFFINLILLYSFFFHLYYHILFFHIFYLILYSFLH